MALRAAFSFASNPFFWVPVSDEALTWLIRSWITACGVLTVTVKLQVAVLPAQSLAVYVTVVVPIGNTEPLATLGVTVTPAQLSLAVGAVYVAFAPVGQVGSLTISAGQLPIVGGVLSVTVMV